MVMYKNIKKIRKIMCLVVMMAVMSLAGGCALMPDKIYTSTIFAMDTIMELQIAGDRDYTPVAEEYIRSLEKELSVTDSGSEIARLNSGGTLKLSKEVSHILEGAIDVCQKTDGALDITVYPVLKAWGFTTGQYRVPSDEEIDRLLKNVDYREIKTARDDTSASGEGEMTVELKDGMQLDLGSVAKGYTGSAVADRLRKLGVEHALLNLGGNVQCIGTKPNNEKWKVAVKSPFLDSTTGMLGVIEADDVAIITSGGYERYFEEGGEVYWHILDPRTGKPAKNGLASVTIVGKDGLKCDGLSTALFVKGLDDAIEYWRERDDFEAVFITDDREVYVTQGLSELFSLTAEYYDAPLHVITR